MAVTPQLKEIIKDLAGFTKNPLGWVMYSFPWGEGELKGKDGPDEWQKEVLIRIGQELQENNKESSQIIQEAVASGHGVGKSALVAWIIEWGLHTFEDTKIVVTANTENQLKTKTWAELAKWHRLCFYSKYFFEFTATALYSVEKDHEKTWRADMIPWSINNTEAFAGLHNEGKRIIIVFDEASAIPDAIWEVTEGALTDEHTQIMWFAFGNPTMNTGRFRECFGKFRHRWNNTRVDSREVKITNKEKIQQWVDDYGEDSDFVKVRVRGDFPSSSWNQFIPEAPVSEGMLKYTVEEKVYKQFPLVFGIDLARFGDDENSLVKRQGRKVFPIKRWRLDRGRTDTMLSAGMIVDEIEKDNPQVVFMDCDGLGGPIADRVRQLIQSRGGKNIIIDINSGLAASNKEKYFNKRAEMWGDMKDAVTALLDLPNDDQLKRQLIGPEYGFDNKNRIKIERKEDMKKRGIDSPNDADGLAYTYGSPVIIEPDEEPENDGYIESHTHEGWQGA